MPGPSAQTIETEVDQFIPVPYSELVTQLSKRYLVPAADAETAVGEFDQFADNIMIIVTSFYMKLTSKVKDYWSKKHSKSENDDAAVLTQLRTLLSASQYTPLTEAGFDTAIETSFEFNFPTMIHWNRTDADFFTKWYRSSPVNNPYGDDIPHFAQHLMIATRGASTVKKKAWFLWEKIDILLVMLSDWVWYGLLRQPRPVREERIQLTSSRSESIFGHANLKRRTLAEEVELHGWRSLLRSSEVMEPVFHNVVLVYRERDERKFTSERHPVQMMQFSDVPFGDLEALFPFKTIQLPPLDTIKFSLQVAMLLSFLHVSLAELMVEELSVDEATLAAADEGAAASAMGDASTNPGGTWKSFTLIAVLVLGLLTRLISLIFYYLGIVTFYERELDEWLEKKREGRNGATLSRLCDDVCTQEAKEMLLGYFFLWRMGPTSLQKLDAQIERFLMKEFGVETDFDAVDAINKLVAVNLVAPCDELLMDSFSGGAFNRKLRPDDRFEIVVDPSEWLMLHPMDHIKLLRIR